MAKVDDLLQRWTKQIVLTIVARLAHGSPQQRISPSKESRSRQIRNPKTQENQDHPRLSCKIEYLHTSNHSDESIASEFFTGDEKQLFEEPF
jgi:hypothetical protein